MNGKRTMRSFALETMAQRPILAFYYQTGMANKPRGILFTEEEIANIREFACDRLAVDKSLMPSNFSVVAA
jgi:hypothetical protein